MKKVNNKHKKFTENHNLMGFYLGIEYYLAARATFPMQLTASAVLFHHAIERFLLSELMPGKSQVELKKLYGNHSLEKHWADFKQRKNLPKKHELDDIVRSFETFDLRFLNFDKTEVRFVSYRKDLKPRTKDREVDKSYTILLEDADYFFKRIVEILEIEPKFVLGMLLYPEGRLSSYIAGNAHSVLTAEVLSNLNSPLVEFHIRKVGQVISDFIN
ncbi:MAG: hypothetical protein AUJ41_01400 [Candidatus Pacebacteria bacterium CG1_02_43_31]|nr:hypothetical protein [Candidatus Paceibacterota bacterium]NCS86813.1 hypothetical protein [Candidatus Paceibacterota bacterium]OIO44894.1 MAG: hypothetical protein AUJ41_01400 [Candidatus Pacebacteria bacterium CG1_02_43_31]PIQ80524.1 MAG: hypothetical protein COV78_04995 [Candidatus Pacebacteria bacterium CG11_big_fil_rev_8_21_14_0_20_34_55]PJC44160.1 MAG: hypothetical protein CO039_00150 [Candidatus Pacebacteria bacterium CG_4_9_14_0_2_um_filter_34_50]